MQRGMLFEDDELLVDAREVQRHISSLRRALTILFCEAHFCMVASFVFYLYFFCQAEIPGYVTSMICECVVLIYLRLIVTWILCHTVDFTIVSHYDGIGYFYIAMFLLLSLVTSPLVFIFPFYLSSLQFLRSAQIFDQIVSIIAMIYVFCEKTFQICKSCFGRHAPAALVLNPEPLEGYRLRIYDAPHNNEISTECVICCLKFSGQLVELACGHTFHLHCMEEWFHYRLYHYKKHPNCPSCVQNLILESVSSNQLNENSL
jgi:hypothetical protein